jgi:integrase
LPYSAISATFARIEAVEGMGALALQYTILTAARSGEALGARWEEIDFDAAVWTVPASRMKARKAHTVPLSGAALAVLDHMRSISLNEFVFFGQRDGAPISNMAMSMVLRRLDLDVTTHGFRSCFRDWAGDQTSHAREVAEAALAHRGGDSVELAYRRGDALEKRRHLMQDWADYCAPKSSG